MLRRGTPGFRFAQSGLRTINSAQIFVDRGHRQKSWRLLCFSCARCPGRAALSTGYQQSRASWLDDSLFDATFAASRSRQGAFARHCDGRTGCGVPRVAVCKQLPGGSGNPPSAITSGREELADGEASLLHPRGTGPTTAAVERREASVADGMGRKAPRYAPAGLRHWPADGCRCTRAPVGAPLPSCLTRGHGKPRRARRLARTMTRA